MSCAKPGLVYADDNDLFLGCECGFDHGFGDAATIAEILEAEAVHHHIRADPGE